MAQRHEQAKRYTEKYKSILLPCKYCGNTDINIVSERHFFGDNRVYWSVCCSTHACDCTGDYPRVKDAVAAWNNKHKQQKGELGNDGKYHKNQAQ